MWIIYTPTGYLSRGKTIYKKCIILLMPVSLSHVYNSNNRTVNLGYGYGFALSYHQTLKKLKIAGTDYYQHVDGDGTVHYFYYDTEKRNGWMNPDPKPM